MKTIRSVYILSILFAASLMHAAEDADILLRGILKLGGSEAFSVSNKAGTESKWVKIGQSYAGYKLIEFDSETEVLTVQSGEKTFEISMEGSSEGSAAGSAAERLAEAQRMMNLMNFEKMMDDTLSGQMKGMSDMMRQQMANMGVKADEELIKFQSEAMVRMFSGIDWKPVKQGMTKVYAEVFTKEELEGMSSFYTSPSGQATLEKMPEVQQKTMQVMMPAIMEASQNFQKELTQFMMNRAQQPKEETEK